MARRGIGLNIREIKIQGHEDSGFALTALEQRCIVGAGKLFIRDAMGFKTCLPKDSVRIRSAGSHRA